MSDQETIVGVAIKAYGKLYQLPKPNRHHDVIGVIFNDVKDQVVDDEQGFMTSTGRYVNRTEGLLIARQANQLLVDRHPPGLEELYSESVW